MIAAAVDVGERGLVEAPSAVSGLEGFGESCLAVELSPLLNVEEFDLSVSTDKGKGVDELPVRSSLLEDSRDPGVCVDIEAEVEVAVVSFVEPSVEEKAVSEEG